MKNRYRVESGDLHREVVTIAEARQVAREYGDAFIRSRQELGEPGFYQWSSPIETFVAGRKARAA